MMDSEIDIEGYQVYRRDRSNSIGGGVCLYVKSGYVFTVCHDLMFNDVEALWWVLNLDPQKLLVSVIYRPQYRAPIYFNYILDMIEKADKLYMAILGDLNYDYVVNDSLHTNPVHWNIVWYVSVNYWKDKGNPKYEEHVRYNFNNRSGSPQTFRCDKEDLKWPLYDIYWFIFTGENITVFT